MKFKHIASLALALILFGGGKAIAEEENTQQKFKDYCSENPSDEHCQEFSQDEYPILLSERAGLPFKCYLSPQNVGQSELCKVLVENEQLVIFLETGDKINFLKNKKNTQEIRISLPDVFSFNSQWWVADVGAEEDSVGVFFDIKVGFLSQLPEQNTAQTNFLTIFIPKRKKEYSNENIPKIVEKIEPWLYYQPDLTAFKSQLSPSFNHKLKTTKVAKNIEQLVELKECTNCNLINADLTDADLKGANLEGANLEGANLEGANLERANLEGANLEGANLKDINLKRAYLLGANLNNSNLQEAKLENAILLFASLNNADLTQANLKAANFKNSSLVNANLTKAELNLRKLNITQLQNADLTNANLTEANLKCANFQNANLTNANLTKVSSKNCKFTISMKKAALSNYLLNGAIINTPGEDTREVTQTIALVGLSILETFLTGSYADSSLSLYNNLGVNLRAAKFRGATNFTNANLSGANFTEAKLDRIDFSNANLSNTNFGLVELKNTNFSNASLINAKLGDIVLEEQNLCQAIMPDLSFSEQGCFDPAEADTLESEINQESLESEESADDND